jgi:outer membrane protein assembly factor BamA
MSVLGESMKNVLAIVCLVVVFATVATAASVKITSVSISGNTVLQTPAIIGAMKLKPGKPFTERQLQADLKAIESRYMAIGYSAIAHGAQSSANPSVIDVTICEARVDSINIEGTSKARASSVRRLLRTKPGDLVRDSGLRRDYVSLTNTHDFKTVDLSTKPSGKKCGFVTLVWTVTANG